jgi:hypothetical protein
VSPFAHFLGLCAAVPAAVAFAVFLTLLIGEDAARLLGLVGGTATSMLVMWWWATGFPGEKRE